MPPEEPHAEMARQWYEKAEQDALAAGQLALTEALAEVTAFHCQQAVEKALKAFLTWRNQPFRRVHDLEELVHACAALDDAFLSLLPMAERLSPYAVEVRYPNDLPELTSADVQEALQLMRDVMSFVQVRLSPLIGTQNDH